MESKLFFILLFVSALLLGKLNAQKGEQISSGKINERFDFVEKVEGFPKERLYPGTESAWLGIVHVEGYELSLLYLTADSVYLLTHTLEEQETPENTCREPDVFFKGGLLHYECRVMRGLVMGAKLQIVDYKLEVEEEYGYDLNQENYAMADSAVKLNDPLMYCHAYYGMQYYTDLNFRTFEALVWADSLAFAFYERGEYAEAAKLMLSMEQDCDIARSEWSAEVDVGEFLRCWGNATHYYRKGGHA